MTPFAEHFALGIKDLVPMAFADCAASIDKGLDKSDIQAAWFGAMGTPTASRPAFSPTPSACRHPRDPRRKLLCHRP